MTPAEQATVSRRAQGLPDRVEDPAALARVVALLVATEKRGDAGVSPPEQRRPGGTGGRREASAGQTGWS
jgi:hypothetical protein